MKTNRLTFVFILLLSGLFWAGCSKQTDTHYYDDPDNPALAIFSNTGNNLLTCLISGKTWRTVDRIDSFYTSSGTGNYEIAMFKKVTGNLIDTLEISWSGYYLYGGNSPGSGQLTLHLAIPANFTHTDLAGFNGQRLRIDSTLNGFFTTSIYGLSTNTKKGNGNIYFNTANIDSIAYGVDGRISGLFDADFNTVKITNGRFDHSILRGLVDF